MKAAAMWSLVVAAAGCGQSGYGGPGTLSPCQAKLTGAITVDLSCGDVNAVFDIPSGLTTIGFAGTTRQAELSTVIQLQGDLAAPSTWDNNSTPKGNVTATRESDGATYAAINDPSNPVSPQGSYSLKLLTATLKSSTATTRTYTVTGSLTASAPSSDPASTQGVGVSVTF